MNRLQWTLPLAAALVLATAACNKQAPNNTASQTATQSATAPQPAPPQSAQTAPAQAPAAGNPSAPPPPANSAGNLQQPPPPYPPNPATPAQAPPGAPAQPARLEPVTLTVPAGENVSVRTIDSIDSATSAAGQTYRATLTSALVSRNRVAIPAGATAFLVVTSASSAGRIKGRSELAVQLASIEYRGRRYHVASTVYSEQGKSRGKQSVVRTGIGAAAGALIGGLAGGGKGAAIGSAAGGGAGLGVNALTHGPQVKIPSETILTFTLEAPLKVQR